VPEGFHFAAPLWLLGLLLIPVAATWQAIARGRAPAAARERDYADASLLPHLSAIASGHHAPLTRRFIGWAMPWALLVVAAAGPRWGFEDVRVFEAGADLAVVLDISRSMDIPDVSPSRLGRARQEVQDLLDRAREVRIGLIAFATVAHVASPVTDDLEAVRRQLHALGPDLVRLQGSRPANALARARQLLAAQPKDSEHSILLVSDGDFQDLELEREVDALKEVGIRLHTLGIGTETGGPVPGPYGGLMPDRGGSPVRSRLNPGLLEALATRTGGLYRLADYRHTDVQDILDAILRDARARPSADERTRVWREPFWWLAGPAALWLLFAFRRRTLLQRYEAAR